MECDGDLDPRCGGAPPIALIAVIAVDAGSCFAFPDDALLARLARAGASVEGRWLASWKIWCMRNAWPARAGDWARTAAAPCCDGRARTWAPLGGVAGAKFRRGSHEKRPPPWLVGERDFGAGQGSAGEWPDQGRIVVVVVVLTAWGVEMA